MIFLKHSLITITIFSVVIWVMPVTSNDPVPTSDDLTALRKICKDMLNNISTNEDYIGDIEKILCKGLSGPVGSIGSIGSIGPVRSVRSSGDNAFVMNRLKIEYKEYNETKLTMATGDNGQLSVDSFCENKVQAVVKESTKNVLYSICHDAPLVNKSNCFL